MAMKMLLLIALSFCLVGCDHLRTGGAYRLSAQGRQPQSSVGAMEASGQPELRQQIEGWLAGNKFVQVQSKGTDCWYKNGSHVGIYQSEDGVIIAFSAFGGKSDARLSEETERKLLAYLETLQNVKITPTTFPKPHPTM